MRTDQFFILRHTATGRVMPAQMSRSGRGGWSFWNPASPDTNEHGHGPVPRLFPTLRSAQNARGAWAQGEHTRKSGVTYDWEGTPDGYDDHFIKPVGRQLADLEIVPAVIEITTPTAPAGR